MSFFCRRIIEYFIIEVIGSIIPAVLLFGGIVYTSKINSLLMMSAGILVTWVLNAFLLRSHYVFVEDRKEYLRTNIFAYIVFAGLTYIFFFLREQPYQPVVQEISKKVFNWVFITTKIFTIFNIELVWSILLYHLAMPVIIVLVCIPDASGLNRTERRHLRIARNVEKSFEKMSAMIPDPEDDSEDGLLVRPSVLRRYARMQRRYEKNQRKLIKFENSLMNDDEDDEI